MFRSRPIYSSSSKRWYYGSRWSVAVAASETYTGDGTDYPLWLDNPRASGVEPSSNVQTVVTLVEPAPDGDFRGTTYP